MTLLKFPSTDSVKWNSVKWLTKFRSSDKSKTQFRSTEIRSSDHFPKIIVTMKYKVVQLKIVLTMKNKVVQLKTVLTMKFKVV